MDGGVLIGGGVVTGGVVTGGVVTGGVVTGGAAPLRPKKMMAAMIVNGRSLTLRFTESTNLGRPKQLDYEAAPVP